MYFFKKLFNREVSVVGNDSIDTENRLYAAICDSLEPYFSGSGDNWRDMDLNLWILDAGMHTLLTKKIEDGSAVLEISDKIYVESGVRFKSIKIFTEDTNMPDNVCQVSGIGVFYNLCKINEAESYVKAIISICNGFGSIIGDTYILDSKMFDNNPNMSVNIGAGKYNNLTHGVFRENQIAIDDDINSPQYDNNKYVSRSHAHISYSKDDGFMFYVDSGGTRLSNKRTRILRNSGVIEVNNTLVPVSLLDGDKIELSKHVLLQYSVIK